MSRTDAQNGLDIHFKYLFFKGQIPLASSAGNALGKNLKSDLGGREFDGIVIDNDSSLIIHKCHLIYIFPKELPAEEAENSPRSVRA